MRTDKRGSKGGDLSTNRPAGQFVDKSRHQSWLREGYEVSTDPARLDRAFVHRELAATYWAAGRARDLQDKANANSICFGVYASDGRQIGFARLVTDRATFAYLADVFIVEGAAAA